MGKNPFKILMLLLIAVTFASCAGKKPGGGGGGGGDMGGGGGGGCRPGAGNPVQDGDRDLGFAPTPAEEAPIGDSQGQGLIGQADPVGNLPGPGVGIAPSGVSPNGFNDFTAPLAEPGADFLPALDSSSQKADPVGGRLNSLSDPNGGRRNDSAPQSDLSGVQTVRFDAQNRKIPTTH